MQFGVCRSESRFSAQGDRFVFTSLKSRHPHLLVSACFLSISVRGCPLRKTVCTPSLKLDFRHFHQNRVSLRPASNGRGREEGEGVGAGAGVVEGKQLLSGAITSAVSVCWTPGIADGGRNGQASEIVMVPTRALRGQPFQ